MPGEIQGLRVKSQAEHDRHDMYNDMLKDMYNDIMMHAEQL